MAKENLKTQATEETVAPVENKTLLCLEKYCDQAGIERPTLKAIATALNVPAQRIYSTAKIPVQGVAYDANVYNWDAIDRFITRRLNPDLGIAKHSDVIKKAIELDIEFKSNDKRKMSRGGVKADIIVSFNRSMPARRGEIVVGQKVMLRQEKLPIVHEVIFVTDTHVTLKEVESPVMSSYSNWTVNQKFLTNESHFEKFMADRSAALGTVETEAENGTAKA